MRVYGLLISLILSLIAGCATSPPPRPQDGSAAPRDSARPTAPAKVAVQPPRSEAARVLLTRADAAPSPSQAIGLLERAIRIEPREPLLWTRLSAAHLAEGNLGNAMQHARKAIALAAANSLKATRAWLQLADVLEASGDVNEASSLRRRYDSF